MESEHGITCKCGQTFKTSKKFTEHVAVQRVLEEVKRIGGEKFYEVLRQWENDAHSGDVQEFVQNRDLELKPENATQIAKEEIKHIVAHHDEYSVADRVQS